MKFWPRYIGDWKKKTAHLSLLEKGCYSELLDHCYANEEPLPGQIDRIFAICGARTPIEQRAVEVVLKMFFVKNGEGFYNERAKEEIGKWKEKAAKASQSARKRWDRSDKA